MDSHRLVPPITFDTVSFNPPFSCFAYVDKIFPGNNPAIRRLFSLARSDEAQTLIIERIRPAGMISDENLEIESIYPGYKMTDLARISFWQSSITSKKDLESVKNEDCIGYAILKQDSIPEIYIDGSEDGVLPGFKHPGRWCIFEAVFRKYPHHNNCVPNPMKYKVLVGQCEFCLEGILYAQQNTLNRQCAQVALRSLLTRVLGRDISYKEINDLAQRPPKQKGLSVQQIRAVLAQLGIKFRDYDYEMNDDLRSRFPDHYRKCAYAGVESGMGALIIFGFAGPGVSENTPLHVIPFYGHTFNKDTWIPEADIAYFQIGKDVGYIPSECWTSSFLGHDDNFGPNFCIPRLYLLPDYVKYVVEILKPGFAMSGIDAEAQGLRFLYSLLDYIDTSEMNPWLDRLVFSVRDARIQRVVLRAIAIEKETYIQHLTSEKDWENHSEYSEVIQGLRQAQLPNHLWVVEASITQLFPANKRRLGEIVLNGEIELSGDDDDFSSFVLARLPGAYYFIQHDESEDLNFIRIPSALTSHVSVIRL